MKKIYYEKVGRRYKPVAEYDSDFLDSFPKGNHLVMVYPGGKSSRFNIDPDYAPLIAATRVAEDAISRAIADASKLRTPQHASQPLTERQIKAWKNLQKEMGVDNYPLEWPSYREIAEAGAHAMHEEAIKLMEHTSVRQAYEHFQLVCKLVTDPNKHIE